MGDECDTNLPQLQKVNAYFIGDSDVARWPPELLPGVEGDKSKDKLRYKIDKTFVYGQSGATLADVTKIASKELQSVSAGENDAIQLVIACAGENNLGNGMLAEAAMEEFRMFLSAIFSQQESSEKTPFLLFLGPKIEPWMRGDASSAKQYSKLSRAMKRCCVKCEHSDRILFLDCLTMFCGESAKQPGAVLGGKAIADEKYFDKDGLHLCDVGYRLWKTTIEQELVSLISGRRQNPHL